MNGKEEMVLLLPIWRDMLVLFEITDWKNIDNFLFYIYLLLLFAAICWILYCLALHPEHQKKCQEEIDSIFKQNKELQW